MPVLRIKNESGDWEAVETPGALKYTEQTLTDDQQAQARTNIGALSVDYLDTAEFAEKVLAILPIAEDTEFPTTLPEAETTAFPIEEG